MRNNESDTSGCIIYAILVCIYGIGPFFADGLYKEPVFGYIFGIIAVIFSIRAYYMNNKLAEKVINAEREQKNTQYKCDRKISEIQAEYKKKEAELLRKEEICKRAINESAPFTYSATLQADMRTVIFDNEAKNMIYKKRPARSSAEVVKELKAKTNAAIKEGKECKYKFEYLLQVFPEIKRYIDTDEALLNLSNYSTYGDFIDNVDHSQDYLSKEEYENMSVDNRNQLALDRWVKGEKSNWTIGMLYEMYIGHLLKTRGYNVIQFGIVNGLNDLGRDIIATKIDFDGTIKTYVIQCKNWSTKKEIHENVICQLYGTTIEYQINNIQPSLFQNSEEVVPVLYTTTELSRTANIFSKKLGVKVFVEPLVLDSLPLIKCNINNGKKIYHLPFDQQYWKTVIDKDGEFYASTVQEAVSAGFRRAYRYRGLSE